MLWVILSVIYKDSDFTAFCYPFAIAVLSDGIDIRCIQEESIQQKIDITGKYGFLLSNHLIASEGNMQCWLMKEAAFMLLPPIS